MEPRTGKSIYSGPGLKPPYNNMKRNNILYELNKLEMERKILELRIEKVEKTIHNVQSEVHSINSVFKEKRRAIEENIEPSALSKRHVTFEY
jgi:hypothetical protein